MGSVPVLVPHAGATAPGRSPDARARRGGSPRCGGDGEQLGSLLKTKALNGSGAEELRLRTENTDKMDPPLRGELVMESTHLSSNKYYKYSYSLF
jgi:hypothetical protein